MRGVPQSVRAWVFGLAVVAGVGLSAQSSAIAEDDLMDTKKHPTSVTMAMQADSFFGFNPAVYGTYGLTDNISLAFGFTYWTQINGIGVHNNAPWLETDFGLNFKFLDKRLSITPMIGFVHGTLLSSRGGFFPNGGGSVNERTTAFDGAVPNITMNYMDDRLEGEFYLGYYKALRSEGGPGGGGTSGCSGVVDSNCLGASRGTGRGTWDFLHFWANAGVRLNSLWSIGGHYEQLLTTRDNSAPGAAQDYYRWIGPYVEMKLPGDMAFRFTVGKDLTNNDDFYKLKFTKTF
ncbi:MAG: DUF6733 family protein [Nitrospiraceae bacterium]